MVEVNKVATCFVIGPIGDRFAPLGSTPRQSFEDALDVFEKIIVEACAQVGIEPVRADQISLSGEIPEQVFRHLRDDDIVIADVSGGNANVMYELGLRHTTGKLTIQIGEYGQLPFDIQAIRTIQFSRSARGLIDARNELVSALQIGLLEGQDPLTSTRIWRQAESVPAIETPTEPDAIQELDEDDAPGLLDQMATMESEMLEMVGDIESVSRSVEEIGALTESVGAEIERANQSAASMKERMAIIARFANSITPPSDELENSTRKFSDRMDTIDSPVSSILRTIADTPLENRPDDWEEFLDVLIGLSESSREGMEGMNSFGSAAAGLGGVSRTLRGPGKKINSSVRLLSESVSKIVEWERMARAIKLDSPSAP